VWGYTSTPYVFMEWCLIKHNFTFTYAHRKGGWVGPTTGLGRGAGPGRHYTD